MKLCLAIAFALLTGLPTAAVGQDTTTPTPSDLDAAYAAALADYKSAFRLIEQARAEYQTASEERRLEIDEQFKDQVAQAQDKLDVMVEAALAKFRTDPLGDQEITDLLLGMVEFQTVGRGPGGGGDQYEAALPILEALVDGGHDKPELPVWGALAAICTNNFDLADKFAKIAVESGALNAKPGERAEEQETWAAALRYLQEKDRYRERWEQEAAIREQETAADDLPRVRLKLTQGEVVLELFENEAPIATANFLTLVKQGFYDGVVFHRVLPRFMAQGGDPTGRGTGGPGYSIKCECHQPNIRQHFRGTISMAHAGRDTGGSQFFLCFVPTDFLDGRHTAFGRVVEGLEALGEIQTIDPDKGGVEPDRIVSAEVVRDRGHAYDFEKLPER